jgi:hypothetical protein
LDLNAAAADFQSVGLNEELVRYWFLVLVSTSGCLSTAPSQTTVRSGAGSAVSPNAIRAHMSALADDSMLGRGPTSAEFLAAASYVAKQFAQSQLAPAVNGDWFQQVPIITRTLDSAGTWIAFNRTNAADVLFTEGSGFAVMQPGAASARVDGEVIFVGYGISGRTHDDYRGVSVKGRIVAYLPGSPPGISVDEKVYLETTKVTNAAEHGAIAAFRLWPASAGGADAWRELTTSYAEAGLFRLALEPGVHDGYSFPRFESIWLGPAASKLLLDAAASAPARDPDSPAALPIRARISIEGKTARSVSENVVAMLRGSDPARSKEFVAVTAHLDHLGIGKPINGDSIYNGAVDNASGVAGLLELARVLAAGPRPRRSVLLIAVTGEEAGNLGSDFFLQHPPVPLDCIVADVNIDGLSLWPFEGFVPRGSEHSDLSTVIAATAAQSGMTVSPDPTPERYAISGSDQYSFMVHGIPSVIFSSARTAAALQLVLDWVRNRYHKPSDDLSQPLDFSAASRFTDGLVSFVRGIADAPKRPRWRDADFFATLRRPRATQCRE